MAIRHTVVDGHQISVTRVRSGLPLYTTGTVTGPIIWDRIYAVYGRRRTALGTVTQQGRSHTNFAPPMADRSEYKIATYVFAILQNILNSYINRQFPHIYCDIKKYSTHVRKSYI
jgi:hypothetical protein